MYRTQDTNLQSYHKLLPWLLAMGAIQLAVGLVASATHWVFALAPVALMMGVVSFLYPRIGLVVLMLALFSRHDLPGTNGIYIADLMTVPLLAAGFANWTTASLPRSEFRDPLLLPIFFILAYFAMTTLWASHPIPAMVNWLRHLQLFGLVLLIGRYCSRKDVMILLGLLIAGTIVFALFTIRDFVSSAGTQRVHGPLGWAYNTFLSLSLIAGISASVLVRTVPVRLILVLGNMILVIGIMATQTRSAMIQAIIGIGIAMYCIWKWAGRADAADIRRRLGVILLITVLILTVISMARFDLFTTALERINDAIEGRSNTILIRLLLWKTGLQVFAESPVFGVGLGQSSRWSDEYSFFRLDPASPKAAKLGVHNDAISYLAETGIVGMCLMLWLFARLTRLASTVLLKTKSRDELLPNVVVVACSGSIIIHFFYGTWVFYSSVGMLTAFAFGLLSAMYFESGTATIGTSPSDQK